MTSAVRAVFRLVASPFVFVLLLGLVPASVAKTHVTLAYVDPGKCVVSGLLTERGSGELIIGATVTIYKLTDTIASTKPTHGAISNKFGYFALTGVDAGSYNLLVRAIGYHPKLQRIAIAEGQTSLRLDIALDTTSIQGAVVMVESDSSIVRSPSISTTDVRPDFIQKLPALGGEVDVLRALQLLPGVQSVSEVSSGLYVRGGSPDQNLYLLDGAIIYNPSHLGGFLSTFNADALNDIRLIKGAIPAEYGGRLSSVLDLTTREGSQERIRGSAGLSLIDARFGLEGPITPDATFMVSARRMYLDLVLLAAPDPASIPGYYFYDLNGKVTYRLGQSDRLSFAGYLGRDVLNAPSQDRDTNNFGVDWGNSSANLRWIHLVSPSLITNFSAIFTDYYFSTFVQPKDTSNSFKSISGIRDYLLRGEAQSILSDEHIVKIGIEATEHRFRADATAEVAQFGRIDRTPTIINAFDGSLYAQDEWKFGSSWSGNAGLRLYYFQDGNYFRTEPRFSVKYTLNENLSFTGAFSVADQFLHLIVRNDISLPTDVWFPSTSDVKPESAQQGVLGLEASLFGGEYFFSIEGYYKAMQRLYEYKDTAVFSLDVPLESSFTSGSGSAYGIEFFLNKKAGNLTGWIGYTLAWTTRTFAELNNGKPFYPRYDRRHDISVVLTYKLSDSWELGATWTYGTGQAYSVPIYQYTFQPVQTGQPNQQFRGASLIAYGDRDNYRLPPFHKLDLSFTHSFHWFGIPWKLMLDVYNAYNRQNVFLQNLEQVTTFDPSTGTELTKYQVHRVTLFPIIPTLGLSCTF